MTDDTNESQAEETPSLRQRLHQATGDREREAKALADRSDDDVDEADAELAVRRASGDLETPAAQHETAHPADAQDVHDERSY